MNDGVLCSVEGCDNDAKRSGMCWSHDRHRRRDQRLTELGKRVDGKGKKARWARIEKAAIEFADDTERPATRGEDPGRAYDLAKKKFRDALRRYFAELNPAVYTFHVDAKGRVKFRRKLDGSPL